MRVKSLFIVIVLNIFLMLFGSVLLEYLGLSARFADIEDSITMALDMALDTATASEEMFTDDFQARVSSYASGSERNRAYASSLLYRNGRWFSVNSYLLAKFYDSNHRLPNTEAEINSCSNIGIYSDELTYIYEWMYGKMGTDYNNSSLAWANKSKSKRLAYANNLVASNRQPTTRFMDYYLGIGQYHLTVGYLKSKTSNNTYSLDLVQYPTLANMGLKLGSLNQVTSTYTADNFTSSYHEGKTRYGSGDTVYYLTPASLGVTYVPIEVLKPIFLANLETLVRLNKLSSGDMVNMTAADVRDTLMSADNCIGTSVYPNGGSVPVAHSVSSSEDIITDGLVEFDLNSAKVKVDYFYVDFGKTGYTTENAKILTRLIGCISPYEAGLPVTTSQSSLEALTLQKFLSSSYDSGTNVNSAAFVGAYDDVRSKRLIARVTVKIKIHIPYTSPIIQWLNYKDGSRHYDIKQYSPSSGIVRNKDGVWYQYTTYYSQTR